MMYDPLSEVLRLLQPRTYIAGGFDLAGSWSIGFDPHDGIKCYAMLSGTCWLELEGGGPAVQLEAGDCVLLPNGRRFRLASDPGLAPTPLWELTAIEWRGDLAVIGGGGETVILGGHFAFAGSEVDLLLGTLPILTRLRDERDKQRWRWSLEQLRVELTGGRPGGALVAQHLAQMMLVQTLRLYLAQGAGRQVGWLFALADPKLARAIGAIHATPGAAWSLSRLAHEAGMSRSSFARAFKSAVGCAPIDYLARWRMILAGDRLDKGDATVSEIAQSLGYASDAAFSTAFRRIIGCSPREHARRPREAVAAGRWGPSPSEPAPGSPDATIQ